MAFYPDPQQNQSMGNNQQSSWPYGASPVQGNYIPGQPQYTYGNASPNAAMPGQPQYVYGSASPNAALAFQSPVPQAVAARLCRPFWQTVLAFPLLALKMFAWPGPGTFAAEKDRANWRAIWSLLLLGAGAIGLLAYLWGRVARLTAGVEAMNGGRVPQPISPGVCVTLAITFPLVFLLFECFLHWIARKQGAPQGGLRAQIYTGLLIEAPLLALIVVAGLILMSWSASPSVLRVVLVGGGIAFFLYSLLLHVFAVMAVQQLSAGKAAFCVLVIFAIILILIVILGVLSEIFGDSSSSSGGKGGSGHSGGGNHGGGGHSGGHSSGDRSVVDDLFDTNDNGGHGGAHHHGVGHLLVCPNCGQQLPAPYGQASLFCPRCRTPMVGR